MAVSVLWTLIMVFIIVSRIRKVAGMSQQGRSNTHKATGSNPVRPAATRNNPVRPAQRSFAAMPEKERAVPNVERDCRADDKHRFENNLSRFNKKKATAIPNVQSTHMRVQPKMSGNRKTARQLYMGDVVPQGMRVVECGYCAADNLVPFASRDGYKCYFCHYDI